MVDLTEIIDSMKEDIDSVTTWCDELYESNFAEFFKDEKDLFKRLESKTHPITDEELESILTTLPLQLFSVSEKLSKVKISQEVVRMKNKKLRSDIIDQSTQNTQTKKNEEADIAMLENKLLDTVYSSLISRVESEVSFSRELIMSAKKIWDRRRQTEASSPINPVDTQKIQAPEHKTFWEQTQASKGQPIF